MILLELQEGGKGGGEDWRLAEEQEGGAWHESSE